MNPKEHHRVARRSNTRKTDQEKIGTGAEIPATEGERSDSRTAPRGRVGTYDEMLSESTDMGHTEMDQDVAEIEKERFGSLDEYSTDEKLRIYRREFVEQVRTANDYLNTLQRVTADFDNFRKRNDKEREAVICYANEKLILKLLDVLDNLERGLAAGKENRAEGDPFYEGVRLIHVQFNRILMDEGLAPIDETGVKFDPYRHEAMMRVVNNEYDDDTVTGVLLKGYSLRNKVIRPAQVQISRKEE